ncbi:MAG: aldo/keto reductase [Bacteroidaceae bacterium]|nr:aldo/keto reductase [Bacteroidaceae bacterium]
MKRKCNEAHEINRRQFLERLGLGSATALSLMAIGPLQTLSNSPLKGDIGREVSPLGGDSEGSMTYRTQNGTGEKISLLGFGMMRLPREQEQVNELVDYALAHGVNYFDTAPMYGGGQNETATGLALSRHPRESYYVATKMSNQNEALWPFEKSKEMYENSFRKLQVDYIDYYLLHSVGGGGLDNLKSRFIDNGLLDFLLEERKAGRIRHLGFSYHGDVKVFDWLLDNNDTYHWDFVQIQMNYLDWNYAQRRGGRRGRGDANAEYLYGRLEKLGIQAVIMEPLRGGSLANVTDDVREQLSRARKDDTPARWGFRWVASHPDVLTTLSGMNRMEHLKENLETFSPLEPCTTVDNELLARIADKMAGLPTIGCTTCAYCMPCKHGVDIPGNFAFYNKAVTEGRLPLPDSSAPDFEEKRVAYLEAYRAAIPAAARANKCQDCGECLKKCPQQLPISTHMSKLVEMTRKKKA